MNLNEVIKKSAMEAVNASEPSDIIYGTVTSINPITIQIDQKLELTEEFIILTSNVMNYYTNVTIDGSTKKMQIKNGLQKGNNVIMIKSRGGQKYIVLDKIIKEGGTK